MEMKDIDLKKYRNLHFRAKIGNTIESGKMEFCLRGIALDIPGTYIRLTADEFGRLLKGECVGRRSRKVREFKIVPRDPETYTDWKSTDWFSDNLGNRYEIELALGNLIFFKNAEGDAVVAFIDELFRRGYRLVLTDIEEQIIEEIKPKPYEFKKGEPVLVRSDYGRDWTVGIYVERSINPDAQFGKYGVTDGRQRIQPKYR